VKGGCTTNHLESGIREEKRKSESHTNDEKKREEGRLLKEKNRNPTKSVRLEKDGVEERRGS